MSLEQDSRIISENYKGKSIVYVDLKTLIGNKLTDVFKDIELFIEDKNDILFIFDVHKATIVGESLKSAKELGRKIKQHHKKTAFLGIEGAKKILLNSVLIFIGADSSKVRFFSSKDEALEWLIN